MSTVAKRKTTPGWPARLKKLRERMGLRRQQDAADRFGTSRRSWAGWEAGLSEPPPVWAKLLSIAEKHPELFPEK